MLQQVDVAVPPDRKSKPARALIVSSRRCSRCSPAPVPRAAALQGRSCESTTPTAPRRGRACRMPAAAAIAGWRGARVGASAHLELQRFETDQTVRRARRRARSADQLDNGLAPLGHRDAAPTRTRRETTASSEPQPWRSASSSDPWKPRPRTRARSQAARRQARCRMDVAPLDQRGTAPRRGRRPSAGHADPPAQHALRRRTLGVHDLRPGRHRPARTRRRRRATSSLRATQWTRRGPLGERRRSAALVETEPARRTRAPAPPGRSRSSRDTRAESAPTRSTGSGCGCP